VLTPLWNAQVSVAVERLMREKEDLERELERTVEEEERKKIKKKIYKADIALQDASAGVRV
jgi:hypothetical protein